MQKNILVLSHNAFSETQNNGKTLESLFLNYPKNKISQIYFQPESPDFEFCNNYYRMTDYEALNNVLFNGDIGHEISCQSDNEKFIEKTHKFVKFIYRGRKKNNKGLTARGMLHQGFVNRLPILVAFRELIWFFANWQTQSLERWIEKFSPDILFFQGSSCSFAYRIANWISEKYNLPIVLQLTDDYTKVTYRTSLLDHINKLIYLKNFSKTTKAARAVLTISDYMKVEYERKFEGRFITLMNSLEPYQSLKNIENTCALKFLYAGNIQIGRWKSLKIIGEALSKFNNDSGTNHTLSIHSPIDISPLILERLGEVSSIKVGDKLNSTELKDAISRSDILVHVESFDRKMRLITRLSISTKIPEYMAAKRCIFALGPPDIASIQYLKDSNIAYVVCSTNESDIIDNIKQLVQDEHKRTTLADAAYSVFIENHTISSANHIIANIINQNVE